MDCRWRVNKDVLLFHFPQKGTQIGVYDVISFNINEMGDIIHEMLLYIMVFYEIQTEWQGKEKPGNLKE